MVNDLWMLLKNVVMFLLLVVFLYHGWMYGFGGSEGADLTCHFQCAVLSLLGHMWLQHDTYLDRVVGLMAKNDE